MNITADEASAALVRTARHTFCPAPGRWMTERQGVLAGFSGVAIADFNSVVSGEQDPDPAVVAEMLDLLSASGLPHSLQLRPTALRATRHAGTRDLQVGEAIPLMVLSGSEAFSRPEPRSELTVRRVAPDDAAIYARAVAVGFDGPPDALCELLTPEVLEVAGVRCYLGAADGLDVCTAMAVKVDDFVGIFNISTLPGWRRRGYGAVMTARAVEDGLSDGADWAWLQSSAAGFNVYCDLGFQTLENWNTWTRAG
jgi:hypothetical protein